jgi:hypothetical protein
MSVVLSWHRRIEGRSEVDERIGRVVWVDTPRLAGFDLRLVKLGEGEAREEIAVSRSAVDNVEHVYLPRVEPGRYVVEVVRGRDGQEEGWDYALAWRIELGK